MLTAIEGGLASTGQPNLPLPCGAIEKVTAFIFRASSGGCRCTMHHENGQWVITKNGKPVSRKPYLLSAISELERHSGMNANDFGLV